MPDLASAERTVTRLFVATDARDWDAVRGCFADEVVLDMESLSGQPPAPVPAGVIVLVAADQILQLHRDRYVGDGVRRQVTVTTLTDEGPARPADTARDPEGSDRRNDAAAGDAFAAIVLNVMMPAVLSRPYLSCT